MQKGKPGTLDFRLPIETHRRRDGTIPHDHGEKSTTSLFAGLFPQFKPSTKRCRVMQKGKPGALNLYGHLSKRIDEQTAQFHDHG